MHNIQNRFLIKGWYLFLSDRYAMMRVSGLEFFFIFTIGTKERILGPILTSSDENLVPRTLGDEHRYFMKEAIISIQAASI